MFEHRQAEAQGAMGGGGVGVDGMSRGFFLAMGRLRQDSVERRG